MCALRCGSGKVQQLCRVERKLEELWKGLKRNKALTRDCEKEVAELRDEKESCLQRLSTIEQDVEMVSLYALHVSACFAVWVWYIRDPSVSISDQYVHTHVLWTSPLPSSHAQPGPNLFLCCRLLGPYSVQGSGLADILSGTGTTTCGASTLLHLVP